MSRVVHFHTRAYAFGDDKNGVRHSTRMGFSQIVSSSEGLTSLTERCLNSLLQKLTLQGMEMPKVVYTFVCRKA